MDKEGKIKKIVFLDTLSAANTFLKHKKNEIFDSNVLIIAMNPKVGAYFSRKGLPYQNTLRYFGNHSRRSLLEKSKALIEWFDKKADFVSSETGVIDAFRNWFVFLVRFPINYCLWVIEIVLNALEAHKPEVLSAVLSGKKPVSSEYIEPEEKYLGHFVKAIALMNNIKYEDIKLDEEENYNAAFSKFVFKTKLLCKFIIKYYRFRAYLIALSLKKSFKKKEKIILFTTKLYQMGKLKKELQKKVKDKSFQLLYGPLVFSFNIPQLVINIFWKRYSKTIKTQRLKFDELGKEIKKTKEFFTYRNVYFADVILHKIKDNLANYIIGNYLWSYDLNRAINFLSPEKILTAGNRSDDAMIAELSRKKNIPTIFISHGSYVSPQEDSDRFEWGEHGRAFLRASFSFHALQSPLAEGYMNAFPSLAKTIKTGPLIWGTPANNEKSGLLFEKIFGKKYDLGDKKIILHAGTPKSSNILKLHIYESPDEYIQALCELADTIETFSDVLLIVKFRPTTEIGVEDLKTLVPFSEKVKLSVEESFQEVLGISDLLVSFSSTTIEEALQNKIPVLLYGGNGRYQHISAYELSSEKEIMPSAVYHVKKPDDLGYALENILDLDIKKNKKEELFSPYIYPYYSRTSLTDML